MGDNLGHHGLDEHAITHGAIEVPLALNTAVVLARLLLKLDANPFANLEAGLASEAHNSLAAIVELHRLARLKVGHYCS